MSTNTPKLESFVRKVKQPQGGFIPVNDLKTREFGGSFMPCETGFSPMLLSTVVQQIVAYCACDKKDALQPMYDKIHARLKALPEKQQDRECDLIYEDLMRLKRGGKIDAPFIRALCHLATYAPQATGGRKRYPDGGYIEPIESDVKLIWALSRRAYAFLYEEKPDWVEFKTEYEVSDSNFSFATVDFLTPYAAYKVAPSSSSAPSMRDILLTFVWASLAKVDRFGVFNPMRDTLYWGRLSDIPASTRKAILSNFLND